MKALARAVARADGYSLILAVGRDAKPPARLLQELKAVTAGHFRKVQLDNASDPLAAIQLSTAAEPRALLLVGILQLFQSGLGREFLTALNLQRSDWARQIECPVVLWVPDRHLGELLRGAPDFFDTRSDTLFFDSGGRPESAKPSRLISNRLRFGVLPVAELRERIAELMARLNTVDSAEKGGTERVDWLLELARLQLAIGDASAALESLEKALPAAVKEMADPSTRKRCRHLRATALIESGIFGEELKELLDADEDPYLRLEALRARFEADPGVSAGLEALNTAPPMIQGLHDAREEAVAWAWLAEIEEWLGENEKALEIWRVQVLGCLQEAGDADATFLVQVVVPVLQLELGDPETVRAKQKLARALRGKPRLDAIWREIAAGWQASSRRGKARAFFSFWN